MIRIPLHRAFYLCVWVAVAALAIVNPSLTFCTAGGGFLGWQIGAWRGLRKAQKRQRMIDERMAELREKRDL